MRKKALVCASARWASLAWLRMLASMERWLIKHCLQIPQKHLRFFFARCKSLATASLTADLAKHLGHTSIIWLIERKDGITDIEPYQTILYASTLCTNSSNERTSGLNVEAFKRGENWGAMLAVLFMSLHPQIYFDAIYSPLFLRWMFSPSFQKHSRQNKKRKKCEFAIDSTKLPRSHRKLFASQPVFVFID